MAVEGPAMPAPTMIAFVMFNVLEGREHLGFGVSR
jgi:hypothetical protein